MLTTLIFERIMERCGWDRMGMLTAFLIGVLFVIPVMVGLAVGQHIPSTEGFTAWIVFFMGIVPLDGLVFFAIEWEN